MSNRPSSLEAAARDALGDDAGAAPAEEQRSLFGGVDDHRALDELRDERGQLPRNVFQLVRQGEGDVRKPGRPKGARNKRSDDLAKLIVHKHGDPVEFMASLYRMPLDQLVEMLCIADPGTKEAKRGDAAIKALNVQLAAAKAVSEYVHSKKPVEVKAEVGVDGVIVMSGGGNFEEQKQQAVSASTLIGEALAAGKIELHELQDYRMRDGQLVHIEDADFDDVDDDDGGEA